MEITRLDRALGNSIQQSWPCSETNRGTFSPCHPAVAHNTIPICPLPNIPHTHQGGLGSLPTTLLCPRGTRRWTSAENTEVAETFKSLPKYLACLYRALGTAQSSGGRQHQGPNLWEGNQRAEGIHHCAKKRPQTTPDPSAETDRKTNCTSKVSSETVISLLMP